MEKSSKIRMALIGLGKIAEKAYLPIVANHPKIEPILCTRNTATRNRLATQYRIEKTSNSIDELLQLQPDAAMIHSSTDSHFEIILKLLQAGIPVFVDKPLSYTFQECEILLNLAMQKQLLLYLGFNRRFAPLIASLTSQPDPVQIFWKKNRVALPGDARVFVFDDFIHVVDGLRFLGKGDIQNLQIFSKSKNNQLENIQVQWQQNKTLLSGSMNRISGITEEQLEYYSQGQKWQINELSTGFHFQNEQQSPIGFDNWKSTLFKRGFVHLLEDWLSALEETTFNTSRIEDIWETHRLCEDIVIKVEGMER